MFRRKEKRKNCGFELFQKVIDVSLLCRQAVKYHHSVVVIF